MLLAIERIGKRPILVLDSGDRIVFEPRMTGLLLVADPPDTTHLRFGIQLDAADVPAIWFWDRRGLGNVRLLTPRQAELQLGPDRIGIDALGISATQMQERLGASQRAVKVALLDQTNVAGIGNLYASEILHVAGVNPRKKCRRITAAGWTAIVKATRRILQQAIRCEGSTLGDGTYRNALNQDGSYQNHHRVYMRAGEACPTCKSGKIRRIVQAQRSSFYCPACQRG
jgi:formamidopyrimidine-DNA glycosylase